jgi:hypothetical protein
MLGASSDGFPPAIPAPNAFAAIRDEVQPMKQRPSMLVGLFLLLLLLVAGPAAAALVTGKAAVSSKGVAGVQVLAYPLAATTLSGAPAASSAPTGADGLFRLELPPGDYYFLARGEGLFAYYGRNPVGVPAAGIQEMNLSLVPRQLPVPERKARVTTGLLGQATVDGQPLADALIYVYTDLSSQFKGMGLGMAGPTDAKGLFEVELPAGTYYLLARQRHSGAAAGPLQAGDFIGYYPGNPLVVQEGTVARIALPMIEVPAKVERLADQLFGQTSIQGRILDKQKRPVVGVRVMLYDDPQMLNRPLYVSQPSGKDGAFVLSFPHGGTYYLVARSTLGGAPGPGELIGTYDQRPDHALVIKDGQALKGVEILVEEMW